MKHKFKPEGVCAKKIFFEIEDEVVRNLRFKGGCPGNSRGLAKLAEGRRVEELVELLAGINCGNKETSCPDQLARALGVIKRRKKAK